MGYFLDNDQIPGLTASLLPSGLVDPKYENRFAHGGPQQGNPSGVSSLASGPRQVWGNQLLQFPRTLALNGGARAVAQTALDQVRLERLGYVDLTGVVLSKSTFPRGLVRASDGTQVVASDQNAYFEYLNAGFTDATANLP